MSLSENIAKIRNAVYGKDVRKAIADSIEECYTDMENGATDASDASTAANTAAVAANTAATAANTAAVAANTAATAANTAAVAANTAAQNIEGTVSSLSANKADKTELSKIDRKIDVLWKLSEGVVYDFETDDDDAYIKTVPTGAKCVDLKKIGGKTVVWNQMLKNGTYYTNYGWKTSGCTKTVDNGVATLVSLSSGGSGMYVNGLLTIGHKYFWSATISSISGSMISIYMNNESVGSTNSTTKVRLDGIYDYKTLDKDISFYVRLAGEGNSCTAEKLYLVDLTEMYGSGNEPTENDYSIDEIRSYVDLNPEYNDGELLSSDVNSVVVRDSTNSVIGTIIIPLAVRTQYHLHSSGTMHDTYEHGDDGKWWHVKRVGDTAVDMAYPVLDTPVTTDITSLMSDIMPVECEAGGSITFHQSDTQFYVPNSIEYVIKLSEVES